MPITKSAKKAVRQNLKHRNRNAIYIKKMKLAIKKIRALVLEKKPKEAEKLLPQAYKILDKSAKENIIKKNTASRKKSRLSKMVEKALKQK